MSKIIKVCIMLFVGHVIVRPLFCEASEPQAAVIAKSEITDVVIYRDLASVTRMVSIPPGNERQGIIVSELPSGLLPDTISATGSDGVSVEVVRLQPSMNEEQRRARLEQLLTEQKDWERKLKKVDLEIELARKKIAQVENLFNVTTSATQSELQRGLNNPEAIRNLTDFSMSKQSELLDVVVQSEAERITIEQTIAKLESEWMAEEAELEQTRDVYILARTKPGQAGQLKLHYRVSQCGWSPEYIVRYNSANRQAEITQLASVRQNSGEEWSNVRVTFSSNTTSTNCNGPEFSPLMARTEASSDHSKANNGDLAQEAAEQQRAKDVQQGILDALNGRPNRMAEMQSVRQADRVQLNELSGDPYPVLAFAEDVSGELANQTYPLEASITISSMNSLQLIPIHEHKLDCSLVHVATPLLSSFAYREASIPNTTTFGWVQGPAKIYFDELFVGNAELPNVASGQNLTVGLGADPQVRTRRELISKKESLQGGNRKLEFTVRLVVANFKSTPTQLRIVDRLPVFAQDSNVITEFPIDNPSLSQDGLYQRVQRPRGILRWDVEVPENRFGERAFDWNYRYSIEFEKNLGLAGFQDSDSIAAELRMQRTRGMGGGMGGMGGGTGGMGGGMGGMGGGVSPQ